MKHEIYYAELFLEECKGFKKMPNMIVKEKAKQYIISTKQN